MDQHCILLLLLLLYFKKEFCYNIQNHCNHSTQMLWKGVLKNSNSGIRLFIVLCPLSAFFLVEQRLLQLTLCMLSIMGRFDLSYLVPHIGCRSVIEYPRQTCCFFLASSAAEWAVLSLPSKWIGYSTSEWRLFLAGTNKKDVGDFMNHNEHVMCTFSRV